MQIKNILGKNNIIFAVLCIIYSGCIRTNKQASIPPVSTCQDSIIRSRGNLAKAIKEGMRLIRKCPNNSDVVIQQWIDIGKGNPSSGNRKLYKKAITTLRKEQFISERNYRNTFIRYFHIAFASFDNYVNLSDGCRNVKTLTSEMAKELEDKKLGLIKICKMSLEDFNKEVEQPYNVMMALLETGCGKE